MAARHGENKRKLALKTVIFGLMVAALYAAVFTHSGAVLKLCTRGGVYAALPIATVFVFSFVHGTFAANLWSMLGIEAITKQPAQRPHVGTTRPAQRPRARVRMSA
jgi:hypothetical protein